MNEGQGRAAQESSRDTERALRLIKADGIRRAVIDAAEKICGIVRIPKDGAEQILKMNERVALREESVRCYNFGSSYQPNPHRGRVAQLAEQLTLNQ